MHWYGLNDVTVNESGVKTDFDMILKIKSKDVSQVEEACNYTLVDGDNNSFHINFVERLCLNTGDVVKIRSV